LIIFGYFASVQQASPRVNSGWRCSGCGR